MKNQISYLLLVLFSFNLIFTSYAEEVFFAGEDWNKFLPVMKISYVSGLYDGTAFCEAGFLSSRDIEISPMLRRFPMDMTFKDVVKYLDIFYTNEKNASIPIIYAIYVIKMEHEGLDNEKIKAYKKEILNGARE